MAQRVPASMLHDMHVPVRVVRARCAAQPSKLASLVLALLAEPVDGARPVDILGCLRGVGGAATSVGMDVDSEGDAEGMGSGASGGEESDNASRRQQIGSCMRHKLRHWKRSNP